MQFLQPYKLINNKSPKLINLTILARLKYHLEMSQYTGNDLFLRYYYLNEIKNMPEKTSTNKILFLLQAFVKITK